MRTVRLEVELEYDETIMHSDDAESVEWFHRKVLLAPDAGEGLVLLSNCIGDEIGTVRVLRVVMP